MPHSAGFPWGFPGFTTGRPRYTRWSEAALTVSTSFVSFEKQAVRPHSRIRVSVSGLQESVLSPGGSVGARPLPGEVVGGSSPQAPCRSP